MVLNVVGLCGGVALFIYGMWRMCRHQSPRHGLQRRGQIACVGGVGAAVLSLTFCLTPQSWDNAVLLVWGVGVSLALIANEALSLR